MALTGLITFIAGTKAKAQEVNTNFSLVKSFVDGLESTVAGNTSDISSLDSTKADLNGSASNTFDVANAINATHAVNKQTAYLYNYNGRRFIDGLSLAKTGATSISITAGSAYDSTFEQVMVFDTATSKTNATQAVNSTYYVYLIAKALGASTDILISTSSTNPPLPTDYVYYRQIGKYFTKEFVNEIDMVVNADDYTRFKYDYANAHSYDNLGGNNDKDNTYTASSDGLVYVYGGSVNSEVGLYLDGVLFYLNGADSSGNYGGGFVEIHRGQTYKFYRGTTWKFVPKVQYTI